MAAVEEENTEPRIDDGHQVHPVETAELLDRCLREFTEQLGTDFEDPEPNDSFHLMFLRTEVFNVDLAVERYKRYWKRREELMGTTATPLTLDSSADQATLEFGYARLVQGHPRLIVMDPARTAKKYDATSVVRSIYYTIHQALENSEELQRKGLYLLSTVGLSARLITS